MPLSIPHIPCRAEKIRTEARLRRVGGIESLKMYNNILFAFLKLQVQNIFENGRFVLCFSLVVAGCLENELSHSLKKKDLTHWVL